MTNPDEIIVAYKRWNEAIRKHLFENNKDNEEVYLYITSDVLDDISNHNSKEKLSGHKGFETCVKAMLSSEDGQRSLRLHKLWKANCGEKPSRDISNYFRSNSVFECALCFTHPKVNAIFKCGYLNILAYALLKLNACSEESERTIGSYLKETIKHDFQGDENGKYNYISDLFAHLNKQYPAFKDISLNGYPYVGRLRYQLILAPSQITELRELLYTRCITTASIDNYETTVNKIHGYASENMKMLLERSLIYLPYRQRIQNVFSNFDFDTYAASLESDTEKKIKGTLRHALYFDDNGCRPILLTDICNVNISANDDSGRSISITAEPYDRIFDLNPHHILRDGNDRFEIDERIIIEDLNIHLSTKKDTGIWFFEEYNDHQYYIETENPSPQKKVYVVVNADLKKDLRSFLDISNSQMLYNPASKTDSELIPDIIGENRFLYECYGRYIKSTKNRKLNTPNKSNLIAKINKKGGVLHPTHRNEYLINALPEYTFPSEIDVKSVTLSVSLNNKPFSGFELIPSDDNGLIIDILDFSAFTLTPASRLELIWTLKNKDYKDTLYAIKADGSFEESALRMLDVWGQPLKNNSNEAYNVWGGINLTKTNLNKRLTGFSTTMNNLERLQNLDNTDLINLNTHYLINLIAAIGLSDVNMMLSRTRLRECILMAAIRNFLFIEEEKQINSIVSKLVNLGYVLPIYGEGQTRYQVLPPMFAKTAAPIRLDKRHGGDPYVWVLLGCYTRGFLDDLISKHKDKIMSVRDESSPKLVGNRIVLHHTFNPDEFSKDSGYKCIIIEYDLVLAILSSIPTIDKYSSTLEEIPQFGVSLMPVDKSVFPRVRESTGYIYRKTRYIEKESGVFFKSSVSDPGWMFLAVAKMRHRANVLLNSLILLRPSFLRFPSILERALGMMNINQPKRIKAFVVDSNDESHALFCDYIKYGLDTGDMAVTQLKRIFGMPGELYSNFKFLLNGNLTLHSKQSYFSKAPVYALVCRIFTKEIDLVAYWFGRYKDPEVFIANPANGFDKVDMTAYGTTALGINNIISILFKNKNNFNNIPVLPNSNIKSLPYSLEEYVKTELEVIQKKQ